MSDHYTKDQKPKTKDHALRVKCSAGTYIRTLAEDIGGKLEVGAHLAELRRTKAGKFDLAKAVTIEELEEVVAADKLDEVLISMTDALAHLPEIVLNETEVKNTCNGTESVKQSLVHINSAPSIPVSGFSINNPVTGIPCYSNSSSSPCTLCTGSPTMNVTSSTGIILYYSKLVEQNISGTWTTVYNSGNVGTISGVTGLTGLYVTYNGFSWIVGGSYRVTFTVGNQCGHDAKICYFTAVSCSTNFE